MNDYGAGPTSAEKLESGSNIVCENCQNSTPIIFPSSHFVFIERGEARGLICQKCADSPVKRKVPIGFIRPLLEGTQLATPVKGNFRNAEISEDDPESGAFQYWREIGHMIIEEMAIWQEKVLKFTFGGMRYKGLWLKPHWTGSRVTAMSIAGDTPSKKLELDVYQITRLSQMGFVESGRTNKIWEIQLTEQESDIPNASAIIIHVLRYGYLLDPSDLNSITPTLDIDTSDAEWAHMRG